MGETPFIIITKGRYPMNTRKIVSLVMALVIALGVMLPLAATAETNKDEYWEIQIYSELANYSGLQTGWFAKILKDKFNVGFPNEG
jgi:putative aldouronate transport system substrate-binding protein